jgi:predicted MFS family arabinose efflux permease
MRSNILAPTNPDALANPSPGAWRRSVVIALTAFLTVVDLFAVQAILPTLTRAYGVSPSAMGVAVNACTLGMAIGGLGVALVSSRLDRRIGVFGCLFALAVPTAALAWAPDLASFAALRVVQGVFMAAAFTLTLAHLGEQCGAADAAGAFAAYITGNVASNLVGRLVSAGLADHHGLTANFLGFALLNLAGAALVFLTLSATRPMAAMGPARPALASWREHAREPALLASFAIGFCILFAFIGTFTYVNFVLARPPLSLGAMTLGLVYFVFLPSIATTPLAGRAVARWGTRKAIVAAFAVALAGLPPLLSASLPAVLAGMVMVAVGTFLAQAIATGFVGRAARGDRGSASGLYLASYFLGGMAGAAVLGQAFDHLGWPATVAGIALALVAALILSRWLIVAAVEVAFGGRSDDGASRRIMIDAGDGRHDGIEQGSPGDRRGNGHRARGGVGAGRAGP